MFFLEQGALDYITRLEAHATPEAAAARDADKKCDVEAATAPKELLEHAAPSCGEHTHTHLNVLDAVQAAHTHTHLCGHGGGASGRNKTSSSLQRMALCVSLELSIVVHSVIIGCAPMQQRARGCPKHVAYRSRRALVPLPPRSSRAASSWA
jgi:hypothetical protein